MILGFSLAGLAILVAVSFLICTLVCALSMEAAVLFTPAFLFGFPLVVAGFPSLTVNEAIGLALVVEVFGYSSSVAGYWYRDRIDLGIVVPMLVWTVPAAAVGRVASFWVPGTGLLAVFGVLLVGLAWLVRRHVDEVADPSTDAEHRPHTCIMCHGDDEPREGPSSRRFELEPDDRPIVAAGGALAGLIGVAIGEISQTFLIVKKEVPIRYTTGTSATVLHLTILTALAVNLAILGLEPPFLPGAGIGLPLEVAAILAPTVVAGGQVGSWLNSRLDARQVVTALSVVYALVGVFVLANLAFGPEVA